MIKILRYIGVVCWGAGVMAASAWADGALMPSHVLPVYKQECAACHIPYPPGMLPAVSWQRVMNGLAHHYGTDASLEPAQVQEITAWLKTHAGTYKRVREAPPEDRITRSAWFAREHREVATEVWKRPGIQTAAQCSACHTQAGVGRFDERQLRIRR
jgi:mono/diheme cytochrome c family protein